MGKTHSKSLVARHGRGVDCGRQAMCESAFRLLGSEDDVIMLFRNADNYLPVDMPNIPS
jgi:hypothetical protein